jgi:hypothetical protein
VRLKENHIQETGYLACMAQLRKPYQDGFKLTGRRLESLITEVIKQSTARNINKLASQVRGLSRSGMPFSFYPAGKIADFILHSLGKTFISSDYVFLWGDAITVLNERQHLIKKLIEVVVVVILIGLLVGIVAGLIANYITLYILHWH